MNIGELATSIAVLSLSMAIFILGYMIGDMRRRIKILENRNRS